MSRVQASKQSRQTIVQLAVDDFLRAYFAGAAEVADADDTTYGRLVRTIADVTLAGGKRMRPYLVVLAYEGFHRANMRAILPVAAAAELVHIGLLIHDDIIDRDLVRHGVPNVAGTYMSTYAKYFPGVDDLARAHDQTTAHSLSHASLSAALLAGDYALITANELVRRSTLPPSQQLAAQQLISNSILTVIGGELMDVESSFVPYDEVDSLRIAELKTASYSFVSPLMLGATLGGASRAALAGLRTFGIALGIAYQLADDLIGVYGDSLITGKAEAGDIREGKKTYLVEQLRARSPGSIERLEMILGNPDISAADIRWVRDQMDDSGALRAMQQKIHGYIDAAHAALAEVPDMRESSRNYLRRLTDEIRLRTEIGR